MKTENNIVEIVMARIQTETMDSFKKSYVIPGHKEVSRGKSITWITNDSDATFFFPKPEIFHEKINKENFVKKGGTLTLTISKNADRGRYSYAVYTDNDDFAEGGSFPKIIIM